MNFKCEGNVRKVNLHQKIEEIWRKVKNRRKDEIHEKARGNMKKCQDIQTSLDEKVQRNLNKCALTWKSVEKYEDKFRYVEIH